MAASSWLKLTSQTAAITGAASGIGRATAIAFAEQGCNLLLADTDSQQTKLEGVVSACYDAADAAGYKSSNNNNISIAPHVCNVTNRLHVKETIRAADEVASTAIISNNSVASILVNCAGITRDGRLANVTNDDWDEVLDVNLKGTFLMCQEFCEPTRLCKLLGEGHSSGKIRWSGGSSCGFGSGNGGSIINIGSVVSNYGNIGQANYAASKGGVVGLSRSIAKEMALFSWKATSAVDSVGIYDDSDRILDRGAVPPTIRVNCIQPGFIATPMTSAVPDKILLDVENKIALRRLGQAEDVANLVLFLASSARSGYITGEVFECSGMLRL
ncbi:hypothetical protein ACHAXH_005258 [Discostella pseudostelligera]